MNLSKSKDNRGTFKVIHDLVNGILCGQWVDSKVVSFVSSLEDTGHGVVKRQVGSRKKELNCPNPLIVYQQNMGSVDKGDQMRIQAGSFGTKGHFKKWYKKIYLAVVDCMLLTHTLHGISLVMSKLSEADASDFQDTASIPLLRSVYYNTRVQVTTWSSQQHPYLTIHGVSTAMFQSKSQVEPGVLCAWSNIGG